MIDSITGAVTALRTAVDMVMKAVDIRDDRMLAETRFTMLARLNDVYEANLLQSERNAAIQQKLHSLASEKRELEDDMFKLKSQVERMSNYELTRTPIGSIVFVDKTTIDAPHGPVYACAHCFEEGKISTLQPEHGGKVMVCFKHGYIGFSIRPHSGIFSGRKYTPGKC